MDSNEIITEVTQRNRTIQGFFIKTGFYSHIIEMGNVLSQIKYFKYVVLFNISVKY